MKKRVLFTVFVICAIMFGRPSAVQAEVFGDYQYNVEESGNITIMEYRGSGGDITIPSEIDGKKVTAIAPFAFRYANLADVVIPDSITNIGRDAFAYSSLTGVIIGKGVTSIPMCAFMDCGGLENVVISDSVTEIGMTAFARCKSLKDITLPESVKTMGDTVFYGCENLKSIRIPGSIKKIEDETFAYCSNLESVTIQEGVEEICGHAFSNCSSLESIRIPGSVNYIASARSTASGADYGSIFCGCGNLSEIKVAPENKWYDSREDCNGVIRTENNTLVAGCKDTVLPESIRKIGIGAFGKCKMLSDIQIPDNVVSIGREAFEGCSALESVTMPDALEDIGAKAFMNCSRLTEIYIPCGVTEISAGAFCGCDKLNRISIPDSVKGIQAGAFEDCSSLADIVIPASVKLIHNGAFYGCGNLADIAIPNSVVGIGGEAFHGCGRLRNIYYSGSESGWADIEIASGNEPLADAAVHYNSKWNFSLFQSPSTTYDNRLALIAADMSEKAEQGEDAIRSLYKSYGISDCECYNFDESAAFAIGQKTMMINGVETTVLVITARGTETNEETIGDWLKGFPFDKTREFLGQAVWTHVYEFEEKIAEGLNSYVVRHPNLEEADNLKILVTGHSLGGATANMVAARFTRFAEWGGWWSEAAGKEDIYAYTFGAIKVIDEENKNISDGYENIHNIYNYYDSFGPNGNMSLFNASAIKAKFGHTELYYLREDEKLTSCNNHLMSNYKRALEQNKVSCSERAKEKSKKRIEKMENHLSGIWQSVKRIISQIAVLCPVDVEIYASDGSLAGSVVDNEIEKMLSGKIYICIEGDKKYVYLLDDGSYTVKLKGTDAGTMTYSVQNIDMDTGEVMEEKTFTDVSLESGKQFVGSVKVEENSAVGIEDDSVKLFVVKEDGEPEKEVLADGNGTEAAIEEEPGKPENPDKPGVGDGKDKPGSSNPGGKNPSIKVNGIKISGVSKKIAAGKKITLKAAVSPSNAADKSLAWKSGNKKYAAVNGKGVVTLKKAGAGKTVTITASAKDGSGKNASYKIKIMKGVVKDVKISGKAARTVKSGTSLKLKASVKASNGANKVLQWKSGNTKYASVNGKGTVTLKKAGKGKTVKITAMATDGSGKKAVVKIKIK